jgi:hypothetical protein
MAGELTKRLERVAARLGITVEDFMVFSALRCAEDLEALEKITDDHDILNQLRDLIELRKLGVMPQADFEREIEELAELGARDDQWQTRACTCAGCERKGKGIA